jgi:predicted MFS family arabinose efflux permease
VPPHRAHDFDLSMSPAQHNDRALWRDGATIVILALAPAIGVGIARFAYSLVLPDMRASLDWSYAAAGFMNTVNAVGYLVGALAAASVIKRIGQFDSIFYGSLTCVIALALSAASGSFLLLSLARLAAGIGGAIAFVGGGVAAARLSQNHRNHAALLLSLYYIGPGIGIVLSGIAAPLVLAALGPGSWWSVWGALAAITALLCLALASVRTDKDAGDPAKKQERAALKPMALVLASYCVYSVATIAYMTFMIAWLAKAGAGALTQSVFWILLGLGGVASPFLWSWTIVSTRGGRAMAMLTTFTFAAVMIGLFANVRALQFLSAFAFGSVLLAVVSASTAFVRRNYPASAWPSGVGAMTMAFGLGQAIGPILSGAITDVTGDLSIGLQSSVAFLAVGALLAAFQRDLAPGAFPR